MQFKKKINHLHKPKSHRFHLEVEINLRIVNHFLKLSKRKKFNNWKKSSERSARDLREKLTSNILVNKNQLLKDLILVLTHQSHPMFLREAKLKTMNNIYKPT